MFTQSTNDTSSQRFRGAGRKAAKAVAAAAVVAGASIVAPTAASAHGCTVPSSPDLGVASTVYDVGQDLGVSNKVMLAGFEAGWVESHMSNVNCGDSDSLGVFQQRPSQGWGSPSQVTNVRYAARAFFNEAERVEYRYSSAGSLAQGVQRSAYPSRYPAAEHMARNILADVR